MERVYLTFAVLALIVITYPAFGSWPAYAGTARSYDKPATLLVAGYAVVAVFAVLFFEEDLFTRVMWRVTAPKTSCGDSRAVAAHNHHDPLRALAGAPAAVWHHGK